jgi:hypothetical protein
MSFNGSLSDKEKDSGDLHVERVNPNVVLEKPDVEFNQAEEDALHRRMDWRIMPILALLYRKLHVSSSKRTGSSIVTMLKLSFRSFALRRKLTKLRYDIVMSFLDRGNIGNARLVLHFYDFPTLAILIELRSIRINFLDFMG